MGETSYPSRLRSFALSVGFHLAVIFSMLLLSKAGTAAKAPAEEPRIETRKIILYTFPKRLPDTAAVKRIGRTPKPQAPQLSKRTLIATAPKPESNKQLIWHPKPKQVILKDLPLPNVVLRSGLPNAVPLPLLEVKTAENPPPQPPKAPKTFVPIERTRPTPTPVPHLAELTLPPPNVVLADPGQTPPIPKNPGIGVPHVTVGNPGNSKTDLAVASLNPSERSAAAVPQGQRSGQFAEATEKGPISTGEPSGIGVPGLTIREEPVKRFEPTAGKVAPVLYTDKVRSIPVVTLSAPLRPASRMIPRGIEARFQGRNVYTLVIPIENFAVYNGDWIVWFAEKNQGAGDAPLVRAPIPFRKFDLIGGVAAANGTEKRIQLAATITREGKIEGATMLSKTPAGIEQAMLRDLASWDFKPATRDGVAVDVDIVVEIPFNLNVIAERQP
jgi:hypothetical protein